MTTIITLFENQVIKTPDDIALWHSGQVLTYKELNQRANKLAYFIQSQGSKTEDIIGLCIPKSIDLFVTLLGILKAGCAFVAFDPSSPKLRLQSMINLSSPKCIFVSSITNELITNLTTQNHSKIITFDSESPMYDIFPSENILHQILPNHLAYLLFTSGTTGVPKGILMEHKCLTNLIEWHITSHFCPGRQLQFSPISFDISIQEIFSTWCSGGCLFSLEEILRHNPIELLEFICIHQIQKLYLPFTPLQKLAIAAQQVNNYPNSLVEIITAGEILKITPSLRQFFKQTNAELYNHYGATEFQDAITLKMKGPTEEWVDLPAIGKPITNMKAYILNQKGELVSGGKPGTLHIAGPGLARGYLNLPDLTNLKFISNKFGNEYIYNTGDIAKYLPNGDIKLLGRNEGFVKINGFRIELSEIETKLLQHPEVSLVSVEVIENNHEQQICAYIVSQNHSLSSNQLKNFLKPSLPSYMIPSYFVFEENLPETHTGKIDHALLNLKLARMQRPIAKKSVTKPSTPLQYKIYSAFKNILNIDKCSIDDDFYDLGGSSLKMIDLYTKLYSEYKIPFPIFLQNLTIRKLSFLIEKKAITDTCLVKPMSAKKLNRLSSFSLKIDQIYDKSLLKNHSILLTGVTGFLGGFLLHYLLNSHDKKIYCLIRAQDEKHAKKRIIEHQKKMGLELDNAQLKRLVIILGDIAKPLLGLNQIQFDNLAEQIDTIYHSAANLSLFSSFEKLRPVNVGATEEVIKFAAYKKTKQLHYISSTSIFESSGFIQNPKPISENINLLECGKVYGGYAQTKWVSENILEQARAKGIPINIYRLGMLTGHSETGAVNDHNMLMQLFVFFIQQEEIPLVSAQIDMVPVDFAAKAIINLSLMPQEINKTYHIKNTLSISYKELSNIFNQMGYKNKLIPLEQWKKKLNLITSNNQINALGPLLPIFNEQINGLSYFEFSSMNRIILQNNTQKNLKNSGIQCPIPNLELFVKYFSFLEPRQLNY